MLSLMRRGDNYFAVDIWNCHQIKFFGTFSKVILGRSIIQDGKLIVTRSGLFFLSFTRYLLTVCWAPCSGLRMPPGATSVPSTLHFELHRGRKHRCPRRVFPPTHLPPPQIKCYQFGGGGRVSTGRNQGSCLCGSPSIASQALGSESSRNSMKNWGTSEERTLAPSSPVTSRRSLCARVEEARLGEVWHRKTCPAQRQDPGELGKAGWPSEFGKWSDAEGTGGHNRTWVIEEEARDANDQSLRGTYTLAKPSFWERDPRAECWIWLSWQPEMTL